MADIPDDVLDEVERALRDASDDCFAAVRNEWGWPNVHPSNERRFKRDASVVDDYRAALVRLREARRK